MSTSRLATPPTRIDDEQIIDPVGYDFGLTRRGFVQALGAGLVIAATAGPVLGQARGGRGRGESQPIPLDARLHLGKDGTITVMTGKVEAGQGARAQITQAAAEELHVSADRISLIMADTALTPDDGITAGSRTTPSTLPAVRQACATARRALVDFAADKWNISPDALHVTEGAVSHAENRLAYADLATEAGEDVLKQLTVTDVTLQSVAEWKALGTSLPRPNRRDLVRGAHQYPYDVIRPGMLYGKILRPAGFGARLMQVDLSVVSAMEGVVVVRDGDFAGVAAPSSYMANQALLAMQKTVQWQPSPHPSSGQLSQHLREHAEDDALANPFADELPGAHKSLIATYTAAYVQHAPMEPRAAVAEWDKAKLTVWTSTQNPFGVRRELAGAFHIEEQDVRVIVPDFGGGFGGKHTGETAIEAARLARSAGKPVAVQWTREEEFTWAAFRPAAVIDIQATLDADGALTSWHFVNINSGRSGIDNPYRAAKNHTEHVKSQPPLRHGSYRALASTANNFARECFIDELAHAAGRDPLEFRLAHLVDPRLRAVLEEAAQRFHWSDRSREKRENVGIGLACGTEKGSFVAACAEVAVEPGSGKIAVRQICQAFECGAILNPDNLHSQVIGAIVMGLGPALREAMDFEDGRMLNASLWKYEVPRFADVPPIELHLINRPDLPSAGAGETPLICVAPAIATAVFSATGARLRDMPLRPGRTTP